MFIKALQIKKIMIISFFLSRYNLKNILNLRFYLKQVGYPFMLLHTDLEKNSWTVRFVLDKLYFIMFS